uniref:Heme NO-binding domain-containing protein n=1 Tax=Timema monikensis TaxID=170555 RepID=A0A7R9HPV2_9NEOP|nr:unnamed protein product [Timema monikensis]
MEECELTLGVTEHEFFDQMGVYFVGFVGQYGYDRVLSVLGRHMRDFLNGLDNLHEYLKFSYPRMRAPSFICENETRHGLTLHYRSKRRGFVYYTMGQIREPLKLFAIISIIITLFPLDEFNAKRVIVGKSVENNFIIYVQLEKCGGNCVVFNRTEWQEMGNYKSIISKIFSNMQPPQKISLTNN